MALTDSVEEIVKTSKNPLLGKHEAWGRVKLSEVAKVQNGFAFKSELFTKEPKGMPIIRIRDVGSENTETYYTGEYDVEYIVRKGDLLIGMDGDFNCARWTGPDALLNQRVCRLIPISKQYEPKLLDYALPGYLKAINDVTSSVTVKHLSSRTVADIPLPLPPLPEQRRIVSAIETQLGRLDAAVARLHAAKAKLKRYKQAVLKAAVEGALTEEWREKQKKQKNASPLLTQLLSERKKTAVKIKDREAIGPGDDLPELTEGWVWASLEQMGQPNRPIIYGIIKPGPHISDGVPYVRVTEMKDGTIDVLSLKKASKERAAKFARATLAGGDVLISKDGTIGRVAVVPPELEGGNITQHVMRAPISSLVNRDYVVWAIRSEWCQRWLTGETRGVALRGVNVEDFRRLPIPLPPLAEQERIVKEAEGRMSRADEMEGTLDAQLLQSTRLRQAVLKRAFEGRLV